MSNLPNEPNDIQCQLERNGHILVNFCKIIPCSPNLGAITRKRGHRLLAICAALDSLLANLETIHTNEGRTAPDFFGSMHLAASQVCKCEVTYMQ